MCRELCVQDFKFGIQRLVVALRPRSAKSKNVNEAGSLTRHIVSVLKRRQLFNVTCVQLGQLSVSIVVNASPPEAAHSSSQSARKASKYLTRQFVNALM